MKKLNSFIRVAAIALALTATAAADAAVVNVTYNVPNTAWASAGEGFVSRELNGVTYMLMGTDADNKPLNAESLGGNGADFWCQWAQFGTGSTSGEYTLRYGVREGRGIGSAIGEIAAVKLSMKMSAGQGTIKVGVIPEGQSEPVWFNGNAKGKNAVDVTSDGLHNYFFVADEPVTGIIVMQGNRTGAIQIQQISLGLNFDQMESPAALDLSKDGMYNTWFHFDNVVYAQNADMIVMLDMTKNGAQVVFNDYLGCNWGSSASPVGEGEFSVNMLPRVKDLKTVELKACTPNGGTGTLKGVTVGNTDFEGAAADLNDTAADYTYTSATAATGKLAIKGEMTNADKKFFNLESLQLTFDHNGQSTAVNNISVDADADEQAYDVFGRPVDDNYRGIVICKGKKFLRR